MTNAVRRFLRLGMSVVPLLLSACSTEEVYIYPTPITPFVIDPDGVPFGFGWSTNSMRRHTGSSA